MAAYKNTLRCLFLCGGLGVLTIGIVILVVLFLSKDVIAAAFMFGIFGFVSLCFFIIKWLDLARVYRIESAFGRKDYVKGLRELNYAVCGFQQDPTILDSRIINYLGLFKRAYGELKNEDGLALVGRTEELVQEFSAITVKIAQITNSEKKQELLQRYERLKSKIGGLINSFPIHRK